MWRWSRTILLVILFFSTTNSSISFSVQESPYKLPYPAGKECIVKQGNFGSYSHRGKAQYAFDFNLADGDPVIASRPGRVLAVKDTSNEGGCDPKYKNKPNYVIIDHGDGTSALYLHL